MLIACNKKWDHPKTKNALWKTKLTVSQAGPDAGVLFSLEQWTHHPHNSRSLFWSRCVKAWPCSTRSLKNHFTNGLFLSHFSGDWDTQTTCDTRAALPSGSFSPVHDNICVTITLSRTFWSSKACWWPTFTLASNFEHPRHWSIRKDKILCRTDLFKDSARKAEEEHINTAVLYVNLPNCLCKMFSYSIFPDLISFSAF